MSEYGNLIVIKGKVSEERLPWLKDICLDDAKNMTNRRPGQGMPTFEQLKDYTFFQNYCPLRDETDIGWKAHD